ncbi:MAG: hypothetical protein NTY38_16425 [Acidobacteria bacterium]|nr:hypothetical protein [Acidobacteriota bacterium]
MVNGASFRPGPVAAGELITIRGSGLGPADGVLSMWAFLGLVTTSLGGTEARFDGTRSVLLFAQDERVDAVVPLDTAGKETPPLLEVTWRDATPFSAPVAVTPVAPGIFIQSPADEGEGGAALLNPDGSMNSAGNPSPRGDGQIVRVWATGIARFAAADVTARIGDVDARVTYAGASPLQASGIYEVDIEVPAAAPSGPAVPLLIAINGFYSQPNVTMAVQ